MKCLPVHGPIYDHDGALPTENWHLQSVTMHMVPLATAITDIWHTLKEIQGKDQE